MYSTGEICGGSESRNVGSNFVKPSVGWMGPPLGTLIRWEARGHAWDAEWLIIRFSEWKMNKWTPCWYGRCLFIKQTEWETFRGYLNQLFGRTFLN